ncbi:MAG TPA: radical SAM family heme chaperone HemW [Candidatus Baltobacteraceae bacterium]|jgi:oxygen-independent coproporphyrinogen-3 oxidase|nr:radical SAM family heme chaperone HemW [Candidatus Baltobacteraceae bacterium]
MPGVYVHLPFCPYLCPYCDFAKRIARAGEPERYLSALRAEMLRLPSRSAATIFIGGGTPNAYPMRDLAGLIVELRKHFRVPPDAEISVELNPDPGLCAELELLRPAGVTRLSFGVQSMIEAELRVLGRQHRAEDVRTVVGFARNAGFSNLSADLIFGAPGQSVESWMYSLDEILALEFKHVSTYGLTIEDGTPYAGWYAREPARFADEGLQSELYAIAMERLPAAGYEQYEISNFARPGFRCRHNENYWADGEYLGLGVGAAAHLDGERTIHTRDFETYVGAALRGESIPGERESLVGAPKLGEAIMLALRTAAGVELRAFANRYQSDFRAQFRRELEEMRTLGLIEETETHVRLTRNGRMLANEVAAAFIVLP